MPVIPYNDSVREICSLGFSSPSVVKPDLQWDQNFKFRALDEYILASCGSSKKINISPRSLSIGLLMVYLVHFAQDKIFDWILPL